MNRTMANTIPPTLASHSRLHSTLMMFYTDNSKTFDDIVTDYRRNPQDFEATFLRQPGAGRKTLNVLLDFLDNVGADNQYAGRIAYVTREDAMRARKAIDESCHYISSDSDLYHTLRNIERWLTAGTLHIEQDKDPREVFDRSQR
jgi:hypothetical protein